MLTDPAAGKGGVTGAVLSFAAPSWRAGPGGLGLPSSLAGLGSACLCWELPAGEANSAQGGQGLRCAEVCGFHTKGGTSNTGSLCFDRTQQVLQRDRKEDPSLWLKDVFLTTILMSPC